MELDLTPHRIRVETVVNGPIETNTYLFGCEGVWVAIDPAWDGGRLVEHFRAAHPGEQLLGAVCTHGHADHVGGVAGMRSVLGPDALYALSERDADMPAVNIAEQRSMWGIDTPDPGSPTCLLHEGGTVAVGSASLQVIETPGHTPGGIVLFTVSDDGPMAFVGDTLFPGSHGRTDLRGGDEAAIVRSLQKLARMLPPETRCLTGHGPATSMAVELQVNPFIAQGQQF